MKFAASIRILFVLFLAIGFVNQSNTGAHYSAFAPQEMANHPVDRGNLASHQLIDVPHGDDILDEVQVFASTPAFIFLHSFTHQVPAPVLAEPSPCWQPPEFRS